MAGPQAWLAGPQAWLDDSKGRTDEWTNKRDGKSSHSTGLCPLSGLLPKTTMQSICYLKLPWVCLDTIYPICDHDPNSPKMAKNMPETTSYTLSTSDMISMLLYHSNQSPIGIKWSAVPLPCSTFLGFHGGKQGSGPDRG